MTRLENVASEFPHFDIHKNHIIENECYSYRFEIFRDDKGIVVLQVQSRKVLHLSYSKNIGDEANLANYSISPSFATNFHNFHNIP